MKKRILKIFSGLLVILIFAIYIGYKNGYLDKFSYAKEEPVIKENVHGNLEVYFIDVGQADAILIRENNKNMLIDAGNNEDGALLVNYFKSLNITSFDYVIGTHAHEDHIGGMDDIIKNFDIKTFYMPDAITTTKTFKDVLDALEEKQIAYETPSVGDEINLDDIKFDILYVGEDNNDLNDTSIVLKLIDDEISILFMGDATSKVEKQILNKDIKATILKVGHHGSEYSTTPDFLDKVNPQIAIIEVGNNNIYDHPKQETIEKLENRNIKIYRTDQDGTIKITSDGKNINIEKETTNTNG